MGRVLGRRAAAANCSPSSQRLEAEGGSALRIPLSQLELCVARLAQLSRSLSACCLQHPNPRCRMHHGAAAAAAARAGLSELALELASDHPPHLSVIPGL